MSTMAPNRSTVYSTVKWATVKMAVHNNVAPVSRLKSVMHDVNFLRSDLRCQQYVSNMSNITLRYLGSEQKGKVSK